MVYVACFYFFGSGNNLIVHVLTIFFGITLLYNALITSNYTIEKVWMGLKILWVLIYITLIMEFVVVFLGGQETLYDVFPQENRLNGLPAYRSLVNSAKDYFGLHFDGLNSITLQAQAYSQYCVMLMIFGFSFFGKIFYKINPRNLALYFFGPLLLFLISPTTTASIILIFEFSFLLLIRKWLIPTRMIKYIILITSIIIISTILLQMELIMKYDTSDLYDLFIEGQINHFSERSFSEYLLGYGMNEYEYISTKYEIALISYMSICGFSICIINIAIMLGLIKETLRQTKILYKLGFIKKNNLEIQLINLTLMLAMFISSIHFPVITNYLGSLLFISHFAFGFYMLYLNRNYLRLNKYVAIKN